MKRKLPMLSSSGALQLASYDAKPNGFWQRAAQEQAAARARQIVAGDVTSVFCGSVKW
jgi:hypothetical protein